MIFGIRDLEYPRNKMLRSQLAEWTEEEIKCVAIEWERPKALRLLRLLAHGIMRSKKCSVIFVAEFGLQYALLGWIVAKVRGATLVVDHFVGTYETHVLDFGSVRAGSIRARYFSLVDQIAYRLADVATIDTNVRGRALKKRFAQLGREKTIAVLPVGAPEWAKSLGVASAQPSGEHLRILFYGNYLPLHGVEFLVRSLAYVPTPERFVLTLIGSSPERDAMKHLAHQLGLGERLVFLDSINEAELAEHLSNAHVVLGIFGDTWKAKTVLANKVWQGLYAGKTVISRSSEAIDELASVVGTQLRGIDIAAADSLAIELAPYLQLPARALFRPPTVELDNYVSRAHRDLFQLLRINR
jgi:glycosyltransferase involved in cell wall biosynthesis